MIQCGNAFMNGMGTRAASTDCASKCSGDSSSICGGYNRLSGEFPTYSGFTSRSFMSFMCRHLVYATLPQDLSWRKPWRARARDLPFIHATLEHRLIRQSLQRTCARRPRPKPKHSSLPSLSTRPRGRHIRMLHRRFG